MAVIEANYEDFEATYYQIDNFGQLSLRKALNLAYSLIRERVEPSEWERSWQYLFETPEDRAIDVPVAVPGKSVVLA
jgi:hypothetical protein